jgi:hypothetical protein
MQQPFEKKTLAKQPFPSIGDLRTVSPRAYSRLFRFPFPAGFCCKTRLPFENRGADFSLLRQVAGEQTEVCSTIFKRPEYNISARHPEKILLILSTRLDWH